MDYLNELWLCLSEFFMFKILFEWNIGCSGNKSITSFSQLEDKVGPGVVNTPRELCHSWRPQSIFWSDRVVKVCHVLNNEECFHCKQKKTNDSHDQVWPRFPMMKVMLCFYFQNTLLNLIKILKCLCNEIFYYFFIGQCERPLKTEKKAFYRLSISAKSLGNFEEKCEKEIENFAPL